MLLALLLLVSAVSEIVSLGAVLPFLSVLVAPETFFAMPMVHDIVSPLGITQANQLILPITMIFISAALLAGAFRLLVMWVNVRLSYAAGHDLSIFVYRNTLYQPYHVHLSQV